MEDRNKLPTEKLEAQDTRTQWKAGDPRTASWTTDLCEIGSVRRRRRRRKRKVKGARKAILSASF